MDDAEQAGDGALRWCASERQLELNRFLDTKSLEAPSAGEQTLREHAAPRLAGDEDEEAAGAADVGAQDASVECVEARAPPAPAEHERECGKRRPRPGRRSGRGDRGQRDHQQCDHEPDPHRICQGEPQHGRADHDVRG